jgi:hypothetical protein
MIDVTAGDARGDCVLAQQEGHLPDISVVRRAACLLSVQRNDADLRRSIFGWRWTGIA